MIAFLMIAFFILLVLGVPIAVSLGLSSIFGIQVMGGSNIVTVGQRMFEGMNSFSLLAIPLFTFAGLVMGSGGIGKRLISFAYSLVGHITGGLAHVNVVTSMVFAGISGSAAADTAYESALIMPEMVRKKYSREFTVAVTAISSTIGIIIPPSIPMVIIAGILGLSTGQLFLGGIIPGIMCGAAQMIVSYIVAKKEGVPKEEGKFELKNVWTAFKESFLALLMPPIIVIAIMSGLVSPTEVALIAVIYALLVGGFVYRELSFDSIKEAFVGTVKTTAKVFAIVGAAALFGKLLTTAGFHLWAKHLLLSVTTSPTVMLVIIILIFLVVTTFMESISTIVLLMPVMYPIALEVGINPVVMSVLIVICLGVGLVTPPQGMCLFIAADFLKVRIWDAMIALLPFIAATVVVIIILIAFPQLILWPASFVK